MEGKEMLTANRIILHIRLDGRSEELYFDELNLHSEASDTQIVNAVAERFNISAASLASHVVVRTSRAIILRPEAIYG